MPCAEQSEACEAPHALDARALHVGAQPPPLFGEISSHPPRGCLGTDRQTDTGMKPVCMINKDHITVCLGTPTLGLYQPLQPRALCAVAPPLLAILEVSRTLGTFKKNIRGTPAVYN